MNMMSEAVEQDAEQELTYRRRAMCTGLIPYLEPPVLYEALWIWEVKHSQGPAMALNSFLSELFVICEPQGKRRDIHRSLIDALSKDADELVPDPYDEMLLLRREEGDLPKHFDTTPAQRPDLGANRVFAELLDGFFNALGDENPISVQQVRLYLSRNLNHESLSSGSFTEFSQWLSGLRGELKRYYSEESMGRLLHVCYVGACEHYGPVVTDRALNSTVAAVQRLPEAKQFPPSRLL